MSNYKAIPTKYNGVQYRSRLEARWAMFFDYLGIEYYYEYEGFDLPAYEGLPGIWYVPDFFLPEHGWFEIKPVEPNKEEKFKSNLLQFELLDSKIWGDTVKQPNNYSQLHYILVGFPLKKVYKPFVEIPGLIDEFGYIIEGNHWLEDEDNEIYFGINKLHSFKVTKLREVFHDRYGVIRYYDFIKRNYHSCMYCLQKRQLYHYDFHEFIDGSCKLLPNSFSNLLIRLSDYVSNISFDIECTERDELNKPLIETIDELKEVSPYTKNIYAKLVAYHKEIQRKCPYRNSKRINDAYQMASKHRFH